MPLSVKEWSLLIGILLLGGYTRSIHFSDRVLWTDELQSMRLSNGSFEHQIVAIGYDVHPPLFFVFLANWRRFGALTGFYQESDFDEISTGKDLTRGERAYLRLPSAVAGMSLIAMLFFMARRLGGTEAAAWTGLFAAMSPFWIPMSQDIRHYQWFYLCLAVSLDAWMRQRWGLFWGSVAVGMYIHYFFLPLGISMGLVSGWVVWRGGDKQALRAWAKWIPVAVLAVAPWYAYRFERFWYGRTTMIPFHYLSVAGFQDFFMPLVHAGEVSTVFRPEFFPMWGVLLLWVILFGAETIISKNEFRIIGAAFILAVGFIALISIKKPILGARYGAFLLVPWYLIVGVALGSIHWRWRLDWALKAVLVGFMFFQVGGLFSRWTPQLSPRQHIEAKGRWLD